MPDPINGVTAPDPITVAPAGQATPVSASAPIAPSAVVPQADSADVAKAQALLETITEAANMVPPANLTRIAELRQAVETGTYQVNPQQVAHMIMQIDELPKGMAVETAASAGYLV
jgi:flagellar biosynthesis anti-sigma factor FlgM